MGENIDKALSLKWDRHFSEVKCFIEFKNKQVVLYYGKEEIKVFNTLHDMYEWLAAKDKRFHVYTNDFNLILERYKHFNHEKYKIKALKYGSKIYGLTVYNVVCFRDMKCKFGSNTFSAAAAVEIINKDKTDTRASFTSNLGKKIKAEEISKEFEPILGRVRSAMLNETPKGAIIIANKGKEFTNVHCYDVCSAYIAHLLEGELPYKFKQVGYMKKGHKYFVQFKFKNLKAKNFQVLPLYITNKQQGENIVLANKRVVAAEEYVFYNFYDEKLIIDQYYTYDSCELGVIYEIEFKELPKESREAIQKIYDDKLAAKGQLDYDGYKQIVNRIYGFFITKIPSMYGGDRVRDKEVPYQVGVWIIHRQRMLMCALIKKVGIEHVVSAHTDGIKFDCNADEIVDKMNRHRGFIYKDVGQWKKEEVLDRCFYFSNTIAKYQIGDEIGMKHGGISQEDIDQFLKGKSYDDINEYAEIELTTDKELVCEKNGIYIKKHKTTSYLSVIAEEGGEYNE